MTQQHQIRDRNGHAPCLKAILPPNPCGSRTIGMNKYKLILMIIAACFVAACESVTHPLWWMPETQDHKGLFDAPYVPPEYLYQRYKYHHFFPPHWEELIYDYDSLYWERHECVRKSLTKEDIEIKDTC
jgi:hypothetical protein